MSDDAVSSTKGARGTGFTSLDLIPVGIDIALAFPIELSEKFSDDAAFFTKSATQCTVIA
jgi:hypothetical protein